MTQPTVEEAPITQESVPEASIPVGDATTGYEAVTVEYGEAAESEAAPSEEPVAEAPNDEQPEESAPEPDEESKPDEDVFSWADIEAGKVSPRVKARIDQLVRNRQGNLIQEAREQAIREQREQDRAWQETSEFYDRLSNDQAFRNEQIEKHGRPQVLRFIADYESEKQRRESSAPTPAVDTAKFAQEFNSAAISEFQAAVKQLVPFYDKLSPDVQKAIESANYDPQGNWFADSLGALADGVNKYVERLERDHKSALEEAREAGRNEARANREAGAPVQVTTKSDGFTSFREVEAAYAEGRIGRTDFHRLANSFGVSL